MQCPKCSLLVNSPRAVKSPPKEETEAAAAKTGHKADPPAGSIEKEIPAAYVQSQLDEIQSPGENKTHLSSAKVKAVQNNCEKITDYRYEPYGTAKQSYSRNVDNEGCDEDNIALETRERTIHRTLSFRQRATIVEDSEEE